MIHRLVIAFATTDCSPGCATYRARPLALTPPLKPALTDLAHTLPNGRAIDPTRPLSPQELSALAILNDPALAAARARIGVGRARLCRSPAPRPQPARRLRSTPRRPGSGTLDRRLDPGGCRRPDHARATIRAADLYVILDIFSRRVVGWCIADAETASRFRPLFDDAIIKHHVVPGQLTLRADRGGPMKAKATALLLADLGVTRSHSRPHTSNDNPFSEAHFKNPEISASIPQTLRLH